MNTRTCKLCQQEKARTEFYRCGRGLLNRCKECHKAWARDYKIAYRSAHPPTLKRASFRHTDLSRTAYELWSNAVKRAAARGLSCDISREWVESAVAEFCANSHHVLKNGHPFRPSLDRMNKSEGYTVRNVRVVWMIENLCRNRFTDAQVIEFCRRKTGLE